MGGFPILVDDSGDTILLSNHMYAQHREAVVFPLLLYGEFDTISLLVNTLEQLILMFLSDDHPSVICVSPPEPWGMQGLGYGFLLKFGRTGEMGDPWPCHSFARIFGN